MGATEGVAFDEDVRPLEADIPRLDVVAHVSSGSKEEKPVLMEGIEASISRLPSSSNAEAVTAVSSGTSSADGKANVLVEGITNLSKQVAVEGFAFVEELPGRGGSRLVGADTRRWNQSPFLAT